MNAFRRFIGTLAGGLLAVGLASAAMGQSQDNKDRHVLIINHRSMTMTGFFASTVDAKTWQEDILGTSVVEAGHQVNANIDDGTGACLYDFKAVFNDGSAEGVPVYKYHVDVCTTSNWTID
jgi:hypothetical protein